MASLLDGFAKQIFTGDTVKDWAHASKIFVDGNYERAPKYGFLYHVQFEKDPSITSGNSNNGLDLNLMVKSVTLPKYNVDTKVINAYGQPYIVQNRLGYEPITITFHDDSNDTVRGFWHRYQTFYYASNRSTVFGSNLSPGQQGPSDENRVFGVRNIYQDSDQFDSRRGFDIKQTSVTHPKYLRSIRVFSFSNKKFSSFMLVHPIVKSFVFGDHRASEGTSTLEATMTLEYEAVIYQQLTPNFQTEGANNLDPALAQAGFTSGPYDKAPSPLLPAGGGTRSIFGQGGIADSVGSIFASDNIFDAAFKTGRLLQTNQGVDLKGLAKNEGKQLVRDGVRGAIGNKNSPIYIPTLTGTVSGFLGGKK